jgi:hypothetical protein
MAISIDGRGRCGDNILIERLWRSLKSEGVYLWDYRPAPEARSGITRYFQFYNYEPPHQSLEYRTRAELYGWPHHAVMTESIRKKIIVQLAALPQSPRSLRLSKAECLFWFNLR